MGRVTFEISMSLDGFIAGPDDGPDLGLGAGGERLHEWLYDLSTWRTPHGLGGGATNRDAEVFEESWSRTGAFVVGRRMFDNAGGWGEEPPFHVPVFVLTHEAREPEEKVGGTTFTFVNDNVERVLEMARSAAGDRDVAVGGGANTSQQFLRAGLLDELQIHLIPVLLGDGVRLFDGLGDGIVLERTRVIDSPGVTHLRFRVVPAKRA